MTLCISPEALLLFGFDVILRDREMRTTILSFLLALPVSSLSLGASIPEMPTVGLVSAETRSIDVKRMPKIPKGSEIDDLLCLVKNAICFGTLSGAPVTVNGSSVTVTFAGKQMDAHAAQLAYDKALADLAKPTAVPPPEDIAAWGDSLTAGDGAVPGADYPSDAAMLLHHAREVANHGISAQTSTQIAARMGAVPIRVSVAHDVLSGNSPSAIVSKSVNILYDSGDFVGTATGVLCGLAGTVSTDLGGAWTFYPVASALDVSCPPDSIFVPDEARDTDTPAWLWLGRNGADSGRSVAKDVAAAASAIGRGHYLVGSILPAATDNRDTLAAIEALNTELAATYGTRYVDVLGALRAAGDGSAGDAEDLAVGLTPRSLRSDALHLNNRGYMVVARAFYDATVAGRLM